MISRRLQQALDIIKATQKKYINIADVGCDHGFLTLELANRQMCEKIIAIDISRLSLNKTAKLCHQHLDKVCILHGDGLRQTQGIQIDLAVVAGMGGITIAKIIQDSQDNFPDELILIPHSDAPLLRKTLILTGYCIIKDYKLLDSGHYYDIIYAIRGIQNLTELQFEFGKDNLIEPNPDFCKYFDKFYTIQKKITLLSNKQKDKDRLKQFDEVNNLLIPLKGDKK